MNRSSAEQIKKEVPMKISYKYPVETGVSPEHNTYKTATIKPVRLENEPYEVFIESQGLSFHVLFGSQVNGNFLCIPNWELGCEMAEFSNRAWNRESMLKTRSGLGYEDATAIAHGISLLDSKKLLSV